MMEGLKKPVYNRLWKVLLFTVFFIAGLAATFDFYYDLNDDTTIKDIISGTYTGIPSGYSIQMLFPLSYMISLLYRAIPGIPWYGLFLCVCQFGCAALIAWRLTGLVKKEWLQIGVLALEGVLFLGLLIRQLVMVQYSVTSGICMATAVFLYLTGDETGAPLQYLKKNVLPLILVLIAFLIRTEMCIMLLPFLMLSGFGKWMMQEKVCTITNFKRYLYLFLAALLGMLMMQSFDRVAYAIAEDSEGWKSFDRFFDARTDIYDFYGLPSYEGNQEFYKGIGLSRESYTLLENYNFSLDESINEQLLEELVEFHKEHAGTESGLASTAGFISKKTLKEALWSYKNHLLNMESGVYASVLIAGYLSYVLLAMGRRKSGYYWKIALLLVIRSILWIYLFMVERSLERITCPLLITEIAVLLGWMVQELRLTTQNEKKGWFVKLQTTGVFILLSVCAMVALFSNGKRTMTEYESRERINSRWESLIAYCKEHDDVYYVVDVYSSTSYEGIFYSEKIFEEVDNSYRNFDICGGWLSKSPLMYEKLSRMQIDNLESALYSTEEDGRAYFIAAPDKDLTWLVEYYELKGKEIIPVKYDVIYDDGVECFTVYQLQHT